MSIPLDAINEDKNHPRFLNVKELADMLGLKTRTIYDMVSQRRIPFRKAGDRTIFLLDDILEWTKPNGEDRIPVIPSNGLRSARKE